MHILITTFTFLPDTNGVANVCLHHADGFISNGHKVSIATGKNKQRDLSDLKRKGFDVYEFDISGGPKYQGEIEKYQKFLIEGDFNIIFFQCLHSWNTDCAVPVLNRINAKTVLVSHGYAGNIVYSVKGLLNYFSWERIKYHVQLKDLLKKFDHLVFLSDVKDKNRFYDHYLVDKYKLTSFSVIPNGTELITCQKKKRIFRDKYNIKTKYLILSVSKYCKLKNQLMGLKAFHKTEIGDATIVFIGQNKNNYSKKLEMYCQKHKLENVIILDKIPKEDIIDAYFSADVFLSSSHTETQPLVILDCLGSGLPFISTDVGCVSVLKGGEVVKNVREMAYQLRFMIQDENYRKQLAAAGKKDCSFYNWAYINQQYEKLLKQIDKK